MQIQKQEYENKFISEKLIYETLGNILEKFEKHP